jgi:hypothetical protein
LGVVPVKKIKRKNDETAEKNVLVTTEEVKTNSEETENPFELS